MKTGDPRFVDAETIVRDKLVHQRAISLTLRRLGCQIFTILAPLPNQRRTVATSQCCNAALHTGTGGGSYPQILQMVVFFHKKNVVLWTCGTMHHSIPSNSQMLYIFYWGHLTIDRTVTEGSRLQHILPPTTFLTAVIAKAGNVSVQGMSKFQSFLRFFYTKKS